MSETPVFDLQAYSQALTKLIGRAGEHVVAVAAAAYRVSSGVVFRDGLIAVNSHALRREGKIPVTLPDGSETQAAIIGRDPSVDTALLQIDSGRVTPAIPEDPQALEAGTLAVVVGRTRMTRGSGRMARYLRHDAVGARLLEQAGSDPLTIAWAREHHLQPERWTLPPALAHALKAADDD